MMKNLLLGFSLFTFLATNSVAQFDFTPYVEEFDTTGFVFFKDQVLKPGEPYAFYQDYTGDKLHELILTKHSTDNTLGMDHYRYQEYFRDLKVEGAEYSEHAKDEYLVYANGKLAQFHPGTDHVPKIPEPEALAILLAHFQGNYFYAWQSPDWEEQIKMDTGDSTATWYPSGELLWALTDSYNLKWLIPQSKYRLAWRFEIRCLQPHFHKAFYVNAMTGDIFKESQLVLSGASAPVEKPGIYPNPSSSDKIFAVFEKADKRQFQLYALNGTLMKDFGIRDAAKVHLDLSEFPAGLYLLQIQEGERTSTAKIVKQ